MNTRPRFFLLLLSLIVHGLMSTSAIASQDTWNFSNVLMGDGASVSGGFVVDTDTGSFIDWSVNITGGNENPFTAFNWDKSNSTSYFDRAFYSPAYGTRQVGGFISNEFFNVVTPSGREVYINRVLNFLSPSLFEVNSGIVNVQWLNDCFNCSPYRSMVSSGQLFRVASISPVPEPESYAMMLTGAGVMGFMVRRRKKIQD
jgi:hypothetical protein